MDSPDRDISKKTKMEVGEEKKRKSKKKSPPCVSSPSSSIATTISSSSGGDGFAQSEKPKKPKRSRRKDINESDSTSPPRRSSMYRGVTRHRWTGRYEAHLWDRDCWNAIQSKKGRQVYLGAYDDEEAAARTYDLAALKYWGSNTLLNFPFETYAREFEEMQAMTREEYLASLRRNSSGFSRGASKYRGVARHHHNGRWEARIGRIYGNKYLYLGTFSTQEEAAQAYDIAAIEYRGINAVTNFDISRYSEYLNLPPPPESDTSPPPPPPESASSVAPPPSINIDEDDLWSVCVDPVTGAFESLTDGNIDYYFEDNIDCYFEESEMIGSNNIISIGGCEGNSIEVAKGGGGGEGLFEGKGGEEVGLMEVDLYSCSISICS